MKNTFLSIGIFFLVWGVFFPQSALAARAFLTTDYSVIAVDDTILVNVAMDTMDKNPNTIEGKVLLKSGADTIEIKDFSLADSVLTNWLKTPSFEEGSNISFTGGVPGGFNQKNALLFKIVITAKTVGQVTFMPTDMKAYDNDGKSTLLDVSATPLTITIGAKGASPQKNQWQDVVSKDDESPQDLSVTIGRDDSVFDGKKFMTISATDKQSGINYFEVAEGNLPVVRTGETYVLRDQSESSPILVTVYDKAGNKSSILLHPDTRMNYKWWILGAIILLVGGYIVWRRFKSVKKKNV